MHRLSAQSVGTTRCQAKCD